LIIIAIFPLEEILTTFKNGTSRALRVFTETKLVNNSIPDTEPVPTKNVDNIGNELFTNNNPGNVQLSGSNVEIGGVSFAVSGGDTLRNTAANKPNADAAHAAIPFCYYHAIDTGAIEVTDGTNWVVI